MNEFKEFMKLSWSFVETKVAVSFVGIIFIVAIVLAI